MSKHLSPALVLSIAAVFIALGGGAYAVTAKNSVGTKQLKNNAVTAKKIKKNAVTTAKIKNNNVTGAKVKESSLATVPSAKKATTAGTATSATTATTASKVTGFSTYKVKRQVATAGVSFDAAQAAAPQNVMFTVGPITIYSKCFTDTSGPKTYGLIYAKTTENGVLMGSTSNDLSGNPDFLNTATPESDRKLLETSAAANDSSIDMDSSYAASFITPSGTSFEAQLEQATKNGTLTGGNGAYGEGDVCLVDGALTQYTG